MSRTTRLLFSAVAEIIASTNCVYPNG